MPQNKPRPTAQRRKLDQQRRDRAAKEAARKRRTMIGTIVSVVVVAVLALSLVVVTTGGGDKPAPAAAAGNTSASSAPGSDAANPGGPKAPGSCAFTPDGTASRKVDLPPASAPTTGTAVVDVATNRGALTFTLDRAATPCTVASFVSLVQQKYFDNTPCHRLTTEGIYVLQCGDPTGTGTGGPGYTVPDEVNGSERYDTGVLAMANTGRPNSGGSQFFIVYKDTQLPPSYTVFGTVTKGMDVIDAVAAKGAAGGAGDGKPALPVQITSMKVVK